MQEWPLKSELDPNVYGPSESAITKEVVEQEIKGFMTLEEVRMQLSYMHIIYFFLSSFMNWISEEFRNVFSKLISWEHELIQQALEQKKLFIIDYHDLLLPFVSKVRQIERTTLYGSRALFFLTPDCTLKPLAIELTRPPMGEKPQWKQVFTPALEATGCWLWRFAKAHFLAHDSGYHELVSHWYVFLFLQFLPNFLSLILSNCCVSNSRSNWGEQFDYVNNNLIN